MEDRDTLEKDERESEPLAARFSQADVDRIVKDRLERERFAREKANNKAMQDAEESWQAEGEGLKARLAEQEQRLRQLEPLGERAEKLSGALKALLEQEKKNLPKTLLPLLDRLDELEQLNYLSQHRHELGLHAIVGVPASPTHTEAEPPKEDLAFSGLRGQQRLYEHF